jgi:Holliday junction resolvase RusA-like endonuclease
MKIDLRVKIKAAPRPRFSRHAYTPTNYKEYKAEIREQAKLQWDIMPMECPLTLSIVLYTKGKRLGDLDNYAKGVLDALQGIVFLDDIQVCELHTKHIQGKEDKIEVFIDPANVLATTYKKLARKSK